MAKLIEAHFSGLNQVQAGRSIWVQCRARLHLVLITVGFSLTTFALSALLSRMIPILSSIGLDLQETALVSTLFGPSQVAVRLFAGLFTERISLIQLTIFSCVMLSAGTIVIVLASHSLVAIVIFMALVGFSSGLNSICRGSLPLSVFGPGGMEHESG
ncbi:hypothetical protein IVB44_18710 [Bradyrhizobium sp. 49]|uniref:hypothetical protein n=1 Tax=unclassified Bradyrhizobium TaxID=2631580 RepID=UPI001FFAC391|nr:MULTISPECIES: hypothetical protein [unclassified Bradyrhizobium]MCK1272823.1 hypothetical protein [Bradyrhizobium sp. 84]MCK1373013.1 hypothetical protein [Bradyrhizobium sp. 49]